MPPGIRSLVEWVDFLEYDMVRRFGALGVLRPEATGVVRSHPGRRREPEPRSDLRGLNLQTTSAMGGVPLSALPTRSKASASIASRCAMSRPRAVPVPSRARSRWSIHTSRCSANGRPRAARGRTKSPAKTASRSSSSLRRAKAACCFVRCGPMPERRRSTASARCATSSDLTRPPSRARRHELCEAALERELLFGLQQNPIPGVIYRRCRQDVELGGRAHFRGPVGGPAPIERVGDGRQPFLGISFGHGVHQCPGADLGLALMLGTLSAVFRLRNARPSPGRLAILFDAG